MNKAIIKTLQPKVVANILNEEQRAIITHQAPKCELPITVYLYCPKRGKNLVYGSEYRNGSFIDKYGVTIGYSREQADRIFGLLNGKVLGMFTLKSVEEISAARGQYTSYSTIPDHSEIIRSASQDRLLYRAHMTFKELDDYLRGSYGFAWNIENLIVFDDPRELSDFKSPTCTTTTRRKEIISMPGHRVIKGPKNYCYVEAPDESIRFRPE